jgi:hypothetical protein
MAEETAPPSMDVDEAILVSIQTFTQLAFSRMGLQPDMMSGRIEKDMAACRKAIDAVEALVGVAKPHMDETDGAQLDHLVRDLKLNYTQQL